MIRIKSLPHVAGLEALTLRAGQNGDNNIIRWPYVAENADIENWIDGGELIFVTGLNWNWEVEDFCHLISTAQKRSASGLVILTKSPYFDVIPPQVLAFANERNFPVFEQPYSLPMVRVTELLSNAIMMADLGQKSIRWFMQHLIETARPSDITLMKASELGIDINQPLSVAVINPCLNQNSDFVRCQFLLNQFISEYDGALPLLEYHQGWLACLPIIHESDRGSLTIWETLESQLQAQAMTCNIGVSDACNLKQLSNAVSQARQSAEFSAMHYHHRVVHYNGLGIAQIFTTIKDSRLLEAFCQQHLGDLYRCTDKQYVILKKTLMAYFDNMGSLRQTAAALQIHRNTLTNRLEKIEKQTGLSLNNAQQRLSIQTALIAERFACSQNTEVVKFQD